MSVRAAIAAKSDAERIPLLEAAFRERPHPAIADLLLKLDPQDYPLDAKRLADAERWARDLRRRDDPRVAAAQAAVLAALPFTSDSSKPFWEVFFEGLSDPRFKHVDFGTFAVRERIRGWFERRMANAIERIEGDVPEAPDGLAELLALYEEPTETNEEALLAAIYAHPEDDAPRQIYADWLTERDDPRGEFITLQLRGEEKEAAKLLKGHEREWLGPLEPMLRKDVVFERGFPARAVTAFKQPRDVAEHGHHPAWATLVEIQGMTGEHDVVKQRSTEWVGPAFRGLRIVRGLHAGGLANLAAVEEPWGIEAIEVALDRVETWDLLAAIRNLPHLHTLWIDRSVPLDADAPLWRVPLMARVKHLGLSDLVVGAVEQAAAHGIESFTFDLWRQGLQLVFRRTAKGLTDLLIRGTGKKVTVDIPAVLAQLSVTAISVEPTRGFAPTPADLEKWRGIASIRNVAPPREWKPRLSAIDVSRDGTRVAMACAGAVRVVELASGATRELRDIDAPGFLQWSPDGARLLVRSWGGHHLTIWDVDAGAIAQRLHTKGSIMGMEWVDDGHVVSWPPLVLYDTATAEGTQLERVTNAAAVLPDGRIAVSKGNAVVLRPLGKGPVQELDAGAAVWHVVRLGDRIVAGGNKGLVKAWRWADGSPAGEWRLPAEWRPSWFAEVDGWILARESQGFWWLREGREPVEAGLRVTDRSSIALLRSHVARVVRISDDDELHVEDVELEAP
ncbi:MAG: TIGR02996 domain-containing protein [Alphaproteobacteria bacterium]|nr:TIGR02996 domain-containing protein [Alphaproteobacteria bacterium]